MFVDVVVFYGGIVMWCVFVYSSEEFDDWVK